MKYLMSWMVGLALLASSAYGQNLPLEVRRSVVFFGHQQGMQQAFLEPGGTKVLSLGGEGRLLEWDALSGKGVRSFDSSVQVQNVRSFSPDGHFLLTEDPPENPEKNGWDSRRVTLWNLESGKPERNFEVNRARALWSADGQSLALLEESIKQAEDYGPRVTVWRVGMEQTVKHSWPRATDNPRSSSQSFDARAAFSLDGQTLYLLREHDLAALEVSSGKVLWTLEPGALKDRADKPLEFWSNTVSLHPDGKRLLVGSSDGFVLLDLSSRQSVGRFEARIQDARVTWNKAGDRLALVVLKRNSSLNAYVHIVETSSGREVGLVDGNVAQSFVADSSELWTRWNDQLIRFELASGLEREVIKVRYFSFTQDSVDADVYFDEKGQPTRFLDRDEKQIGNSVYIGPWTIHTSGGEAPLELTEHNSWLARYSPDGRFVASLNGGGGVWLLEVASGKKVREFGGAYDVSFSPDGRFMATGSYYDVYIYDLESGKLVQTLDAQKAEKGQPNRQDYKKGRSDPGLRGMARAIAWSPDGKTIAVGYEARAIGVWNVTTGALEQRLFGHTGWVLSVAFSPDGKTLVSGAGDGTVRFWTLETGKSAVVQKIHTAFVRWVTYSPDGRYVAAASGDGVVSLWDAVTFRPLKRLQGHTDKATTVIFSPDGKTLLSGSSDGTVRLWSVPEGKALQTLPSVNATLLSLALSPDAKSLLSSARDNVLRFVGRPDDALIFEGGAK